MRSGPPAAAPGPGEPEVADLEVADIGLVAADLLAAGRPAVLRGGARSWPAFERWDFEQLAATVGPTPVVCEVGDITRETRPLVEVAFDEYARAVARGDYDGTRTYASQLDLLALAPELSADLDLRALAGKRLLVRRAWIGPAGTVTGWHRDHVDNVFAQLRGRKVFRLAEPGSTAAMYPTRKYDFATDCGAVDADDPDLERYPAYATVAVTELLLEPGDVVVVPKRWWHQVRSLDPSISVNCFGATVGETIVGWRILAKEALHRAHLYRRQWCTCHPERAAAR